MGPSPYELLPPKALLSSLIGNSTLELLAQKKGPSPRGLLSDCPWDSHPTPWAACFCKLLSIREQTPLLVLGQGFGLDGGSHLDG